MGNAEGYRRPYAPTIALPKIMDLSNTPYSREFLISCTT